MLRLAFVLMAAAALPTANPEPLTPSPFTASYSVAYRSLNAGRVHFELRRNEPDTFVYESRAEPSLLAKLVVGGDAMERSVMRIDANGVRPLSWFVEDGKDGRKGDGALEFAWEEKTVRGTMKGKTVDLRTRPGLQERLSIQIAVMTTLLRGEEPGTIPLVDGDEIKEYSYRRLGSERIGTKAGVFETVLYESTRPGSSRVSRIWHARDLGYLPVRAEQVRKGRLETVMELVEVERGERER